MSVFAPSYILRILYEICFTVQCFSFFRSKVKFNSPAPLKPTYNVEGKGRKKEKGKNVEEGRGKEKERRKGEG